MQSMAHGVPYLSVSRREGSFFLIGDEFDRFNSLVGQLEKIHRETKLYNLKFAENSLIEGLVALLFGKTSKDTWKAALKKIKERYLLDLVTWKVFAPVTGITLNEDSWSFGKVTFCKKNHPDIVRIDDRTQNSIFALIEVLAVDSSEARFIAKKIIDQHVCIINGLLFVSGAVEPGEPISAYGEVGSAVQSWLYKTDGKRLNASRDINVRMAGFHPAAFKGSDIARIFNAEIVSEFLKSNEDNLFKQRILPSLKWLGRASLQLTREEAFLFIFLAFEAIIFEKKVEQHVVSRIVSRTSKLLFWEGRFFTSAITAYDNIEKLYKKRSNIVHRGGQDDLSAKDIGLIQDLVRSCLYKFFQPGIFQKMKNDDDLDKILNMNAYLIHGWSGSPKEKMLQWLKTELQKAGYAVEVPAMPDTDHPTIEAWVGTLNKIVQPGEETVLIGHSIGCQAVLRYLAQAEGKVARVVLIAPWMELDQETIKEEGPDSVDIAKSWVETPIDFAAARARAGSITAIFSDDDPFVPLSQQEVFKRELDATIIVEHGKGHFTEGDGVVELESARVAALVAGKK